MKKTFIIFLLIIFSSSFSLADSNKKITVEEIEDIFFKKMTYSDYKNYKKITVEEIISDEEKIKSDEEKIILSLTDKISSIERPFSYYNFSYYQPIPRNACVYNTVEDNYDCKKKNKGKSLSNKQYITLLLKQRRGHLWSREINGFGQRELNAEINNFINKYSISKESPTFLLKKEDLKKRVQTRGIAKCMYNEQTGTEDGKMQCKAKLIRAIMTYPDKSKAKRPGDIFFVLDAIEKLLLHHKNKNKYITSDSFTEKERPLSGMLCSNVPGYSEYTKKISTHCLFFKKGIAKKLEKLKKDPTNEKVLGHKLITYVKTSRMILDIREKLGTRDFALVGDVLNASVGKNIKKNKDSLDLKKRKVLLTKYSLGLSTIEKKINEDEYKSINKDISKLSKIFEELKVLPKTTNEVLLWVVDDYSNLVLKGAIETGNFIDEAIDGANDMNKFVQIVSLNAKDNSQKKILALNSLSFMKSLIDSILSTVPNNYVSGPNILSQNLFDENAREELDIIIKSMRKNKLIKCKEFKKNLDMIDKSFNSTNLLKIFNNLEKESKVIMKNKTCSEFARNITTEATNMLISDINLEKEIFQNIDMNILKEVSDNASSIASVQKKYELRFPINTLDVINTQYQIYMVLYDYAYPFMITDGT